VCIASHLLAAGAAKLLTGTGTFKWISAVKYVPAVFLSLWSVDRPLV